MGLLDQSVAAGYRHDLDVLHTVEHGKLAEGGTATPELVGMYRDWEVILTQQSNEKGSGHFSVPVPL